MLCLLMICWVFLANLLLYWTCQILLEVATLVHIKILESTNFAALSFYHKDWWRSRYTCKSSWTNAHIHRIIVTSIITNALPFFFWEITLLTFLGLGYLTNEHFVAFGFNLCCCFLGMWTELVHLNSFGCTSNSGMFGHIPSTTPFPPNILDGIQFIKKVVVDTPFD